MTLAQRARRWLFGPPRSEPSPVLLGFRRVYILPTRSGILFAVVLLAMYSGAVNYNLGLGHALVFLLAGLGLVAMLHTFRSVFGLRVSAGPTAPVFAGEFAQFSVIVDNPDARSRPAVVLQNSAGLAAVADLVPLGPTSVRLETVTRIRGWLELGPLTVHCRYPSGLFRAWAYPSPASRCLVYPKPVYLPLPASRPAGDGGNAKSAAGDEDFAGFRNRQPGDSIRHVAWKSFARDPEHRPLQVKLFSGGEQSELCLSWDDLSLSSDLEDRLSVLTGWVVQAEAAGLPFSLSLPARTFGVGSGTLHAARCLNALALFNDVDPDESDLA
jgi:uncharacterized protein (DUF58 family)